MKKPQDDQSKRLVRIILISWFLALILGIVGVTFFTIKISQIETNYSNLASKPAKVEIHTETQLQPVFTTIVGQKGAKGDSGTDGKDSLSTHTETTTVIHTETAVQGPAGVAGKNGSNGKSGRDVELGQDVNGKLYQRLVGTSEWYPITIITGITP